MADVQRHKPIERCGADFLSAQLWLVCIVLRLRLTSADESSFLCLPMTAEQIYILGMTQLALVFFLACYRLRGQPQTAGSLVFLQLAFLADTISWLFYLWPESVAAVVLSNVFSCVNLWLIAAFAIRRSALKLPLFWLGSGFLLHAFWYSYFAVVKQQHFVWHGQTVATLVVLVPVILLMLWHKPERTRSDFWFALTLMVWVLVVLIRSLLLLLAPDWLLSGQLVTQAIWPGVMAAYAVFALTGYLEESQLQLKGEATHDPLTALLNRRGFSEAVNAKLTVLATQQRPAALLMMDLDYFKQINDQFGHDMGDEVLIAVANTLQQQLKPTQLLARFGGEEFLLFLPEHNAAQAQSVAQQLMLAMAALKVPQLPASGRSLSLSIGIAIFGPDYDLSHQLKNADLAMYQAKQNGRCRVELAAG